MFIAHEGIADSRNILLHADKRRAVFWCSSKKISDKEPGQRTIFCNEAVKGMLQEIHKKTPKMVRESLLELFKLYAEKMTQGENFYHYRS